MKTQLTHTPFGAGKLMMLVSFCALLHAASGQGNTTQAAITLTFKNFIVPAKADYFYQGADASGIVIPSQGTHQRWDYSNLNKNDANNNAISYVPANNPAYPNALRQFDNSFLLAGLPIAQTTMEGNNKSSYHGLGTHLEKQAFPLESITGNPGDSLIIDKQDVQEPHQVFEKYPVTYSTSFHSHSISKTGFHLSIAAFGLDHVPGQFVQHTFDNRDVLGWGKVRVPTESGPSKYIKALLQKLSVLKIDSVYLAGQPAPAALLAAFGVTQGETTRSFYQYRFYQENTDAYLINFSMDPTFSTITGLNYDTKYVDKNPGNIIAAATDANASFSPNELAVKVFPNPSPSEFTISFNNKSGSKASVVVFDLYGRPVQRMETVSNTLRFGKDLKPGTYSVQVISNNEKKVINLVKNE